MSTFKLQIRYMKLSAANHLCSPTLLTVVPRWSPHTTPAAGSLTYRSTDEQPSLAGSHRKRLQGPCAVIATHAVCCVEGWRCRPSYGSSSPHRVEAEAQRDRPDNGPDAGRFGNSWNSLMCSSRKSWSCNSAREQRPSLVVVRRHPCAAAPRHLGHGLAANGGHPRYGLRPPQTRQGASRYLGKALTCILQCYGQRQNGRAAQRHLHLSLFSADRGSLCFYALLMLLSCTLPLYITPDSLLFHQK